MKKNKRSNKTKTRSTVVGLVLVGSILIGGTFAFSQLNQQAITPDWHEAFGGGGRIHNISQANGDADFGIDGERNHDIFAENFSDIPLGVRVQLREFLRVNGEEIDDNMELTDFDTWSLFLADENLDRTGLSAEIEDAGISWTLGQESDLKVFMPTFNQINRSLSTDELIGVGMTGEDSIFNSGVAYRFVDTAGRSIAVYADGLVIDVDHVQEIEGAQTAQGNHNGLQNFWNLGDYYEGTLYTVAAGQLVRTEDVTHYAQATLAAAEDGIMTLSEWRELNEADQAGNFWIFDDLTGEGWFFWNGFIPAGEATSLLLDAVFLTGTDNLEYVIHVTADFFSAHTLADAEIHPDLLPRFTDVEPIFSLPVAANECLQTNPGGIRPANIFVDETGFEWCVVATEGNYSMLVARHTIQHDRIEGGANDVLPAQRNHYENLFVHWPANTSLAGGPEARGRMYMWWNRADQVSPVLRVQAVHALIPANTSTAAADRNDNAARNDAWLSTPYTGVSAVGLGQNPVFFLSEAELYLTLNQTVNTDRVVNRVAYDGTVGAASWFWLRSAGINTNVVASVTTPGNWNAGNAGNTTTEHAFRPAVWVRRTPIVNESTAERFVIPADVLYITSSMQVDSNGAVIGNTGWIGEGGFIHISHRLYRYEGSTRVEVIENVVFEVNILEGNGAGVHIATNDSRINGRYNMEITIPNGFSYPYLTIRVTEPRAENYVDLIVTVDAERFVIPNTVLNHFNGWINFGMDRGDSSSNSPTTIRHYIGNDFQGVVSANFSFEVVGGETTGTSFCGMGLINPGEDLELCIGAGDTSTTFTLRITEPRADNYIEFTVNLQ